MKKQLLIASGIGVISAAVISYYLMQKNDNKKNTTFENAGVPDQSDNKDLAQLENAKMVSEGSQFGVQYYNHRKSELENENV